MSGRALSLFESTVSDWINQVIEGQNPCSQVSEKKIQEMYALAYLLYRNQHYLQSNHFFRLLVIARPSEAKFWKGFGASLQMQKDYEEALNCYLCCSYLMRHDQPDPYLYVQAADCYFALEQVEAGLKALEAARLIAEKVHDRQILQHVAFMRNRWSSRSK
jgi:secretion system chaperone SscA